MVSPLLTRDLCFETVKPEMSAPASHSSERQGDADCLLYLLPGLVRRRRVKGCTSMLPHPLRTTIVDLNARRSFPRSSVAVHTAGLGWVAATLRWPQFVYAPQQTTTNPSRRQPSLSCDISATKTALMRNETIRDDTGQDVLKPQ